MTAYWNLTRALVLLNAISISYCRVFRLKDFVTPSNTSESIAASTPPPHEEYFQDDIMENGSFLPRYSLLLQVLIFILCAAGVSAVIILCCMICLHSMHFFSRSTVILDENGSAHVMFHYRRGQANRERGIFETNRTFCRFPNSALGTDENLRFTYAEEKDLPPAYDDLEEKGELAPSPPPPYTPSLSQEIKR